MSQRPAKRLSDFTRFINCEKLAKKWSAINKWHYTSRGKAKSDGLASLTEVTFDRDFDGHQLSNHYLKSLSLQAPKYIKNAHFGYPKCIGIDGKLIGYTKIPSCEECNHRALNAHTGAYDFRIAQWRRSIFYRCRRFK